MKEETIYEKAEREEEGKKTLWHMNNGRQLSMLLWRAAGELPGTAENVLFLSANKPQNLVALRRMSRWQLNGSLMAA